MKKLHDQSNSAFVQLRAVATETVALPPAVAVATKEKLARLHELEDLIGQQQASYEAKLEWVRREAQQDKRVCETSLARFQVENEQLKKNHSTEMKSMFRM